jgi:hypothetical protein
MAELVPTRILVHMQKEWPCACCRPNASASVESNFLCLECAGSIIVAAIERMQGAGSDGLSLLRALSAPEAETEGSGQGLPWQVLWFPTRR